MNFNELQDMDAIVNFTVSLFIDTLNSELDFLFEEQEQEIAQIEGDQDEPYIRGNGYDSWCESIEQEAERYAYMVAWKYYYTVTGSDCQTNQDFFENVVLRKVRQARFGR